MWEFNYGEWTEAYVFLRLLGNGRIYAADRNFEQDENVYIDILNIIRYEKEHILEFQRELESVAAKDNGIVFKVLPYDELIDKDLCWILLSIISILPLCLFLFYCIKDIVKNIFLIYILH